MKKFLLFSLIMFVAAPIYAQSNIDYSLFEKKTYKKYGTELPYRIIYPEKMKRNQKYPVVLVLHGMGNRGDDNEKQLSLGGKLFIDPQNRKDFPCFAIYPQAPMSSAFVRVKEGNEYLPGGWQKFTTEAINSDKLSVDLTVYGKMAYELVENLCKEKYVDTDRIYIAGVSMGAFTTYQLIAEHPDTFAAAVAICGATPLSDVKSWGEKVPIWMFHGEKDRVVPVDASRGVYDTLETMGVENYKYTEYEGMGHGVWFKAFAEPDFLKWLFMFEK